MPTAVFQHICAVCQYLTLYSMLVLCSVSTAVYYSPSTLCQYFTEYRPFVLCHLVHCCPHMPVQWLSVPHTVPHVISVLCVHRRLLQSLYSLSVLHRVPTVCSVSPCPLLSSQACPLSVSTSQCTIRWFCITMSTLVFYTLFTVCQYLTLYRPLVLCQYVQCCLLQSVQYLSIPHMISSVFCVLPCSLLSSPLSPLSVITRHCTFCLLSIIMSTTRFYILSTVCQYLTPYRLFVLCHYVHYCLL